MTEQTLERQNTDTATPDGPHYRTAVQAQDGEKISYVPAADLNVARTHARQARAWGHRTWIQVTHDLGISWMDCADDGTESASGA